MFFREKNKQIETMRQFFDLAVERGKLSKENYESLTEKKDINKVTANQFSLSATQLALYKLVTPSRSLGASVIFAMLDDKMSSIPAEELLCIAKNLQDNLVLELENEPEFRKMLQLYIGLSWHKLHRFEDSSVLRLETELNNLLTPEKELKAYSEKELKAYSEELKASSSEKMEGGSSQAQYLSLALGISKCLDSNDIHKPEIKNMLDLAVKSTRQDLNQITYEHHLITQNFNVVSFVKQLDNGNWQFTKHSRYGNRNEPHAGVMFELNDEQLVKLAQLFRLPVPKVEARKKMEVSSLREPYLNFAKKVCNHLLPRNLANPAEPVIKKLLHSAKKGAPNLITYEPAAIDDWNQDSGAVVEPLDNGNWQFIIGCHYNGELPPLGVMCELNDTQLLELGALLGLPDPQLENKGKELTTTFSSSLFSQKPKNTTRLEESDLESALAYICGNLNIASSEKRIKELLTKAADYARVAGNQKDAYNLNLILKAYTKSSQFKYRSENHHEWILRLEPDIAGAGIVRFRLSDNEVQEIAESLGWKNSKDSTLGKTKSCS